MKHILLALALVVAGCAVKKAKEATPPKRGWVHYEQTCTTCGSVMNVSSRDNGSENPRTVDHCFFCPTTWCMEGSMLIIAYGSQSELVRHQPTNVKAAEDLAELESLLEKHMAECEGCRKQVEADMNREKR